MTGPEPTRANTGLPQVGGGGSETQRSIPILKDSLLPYLARIYQDHAGKANQKWTEDQISNFLKNVQGELNAASDLPHDLAIVSNKEIDYHDFLNYMSSAASAASAPPKKQDLSWPLHSYFVSSSHNTYLTGNQLSSESSTEAYKNVLLRGCRCIEVDVWDGDDDDVDGKSTTSVSSISSDEAGTAGVKQKKEGKLSRLRNKLPNPLATRLKRMSSTEAPKPAPGTLSPSKGKEGKLPSAPAEKDGKVATGQAESTKTESLQAPASAIVEPRVFHGYTLTKEVSFRDVCATVRDYAFVVTDTPLIVSLEVHCSAPQQDIMVQIMEESWKGLLVPTPDTDPAGLPPPADLRGKILVKVKYAPPDAVPGDAASDNDDTLQEDDKNAKPSKITQALSNLGVYTRGVSFKSFGQPEASMPTHIFSLSEKKVADIFEKDSKALFEHNKHFMMRTYPSGLRIRSSNLDPAPFWRKGVQVVALNWQNWDEGMMLNEGMFAGSEGYVLKPEGYRGHKGVLSEALKRNSTVPIARKTLDIQVEVLAAQNIPLPPDDTDPKGFEPYVKIELHVEGPDEHIEDDGIEKEGEYKARTKARRGCNPDFGGEAIRFASIGGVIEQLAFVRFTVRDDEFGRDDLAAWACVRLDRLRTGYRFVHLNDCDGHVTNGALLVRITKTLK